MTRHARRIAVTLLPVMAALAHVVGLVRLPGLDAAERSLYDIRLRATMPASLDPRVVIVDIDERSLSEVGRWPWGRDQIARLVHELFDRQQAAVVGFDVLFGEHDRSSGLDSLRALAAGDLKDQPGFADSLRRLEPGLDYDRLLADALRDRPAVLGFYFSQDSEGGLRGALPQPVIAGDALPPLAVHRWRSAVANIPALAEAAPQGGFLNSIPDPDGEVRSVSLIAGFGGQYYESLALAMYRSLIGNPRVLAALVPGTEAQPGRPALLQSLLLDRDDNPQIVPVDERAAVLVSYRGPGGVDGGSFRYIPAADVLNGKLDAASLAGKLVLVGTTAPGLLDLRVTPVGETYPGVEVHANILSGLLDARSLVRPDYAAGYAALTTLVAGLLLAFCLPLLGVPAGVLLTFAVLGTLVGANLWLFTSAGLVLPLAVPLLTALAAFALNIAYGYFVETRSKRQLARLFGTYVPRELVAEMVRQPDQYTMQADNREMTVMFCDMRGFTALSETMEPLALQALLNRIFSRLTDVIRQQRGTVDKYMGDCVMAFWGAPQRTDDHARLAVDAAIGMAAAIRKLNAEHAVQGLPPIQIGIGLNTGMMCVGDMGSDIRRSYTVIGDAVNLAARLESLCSVYGVDMVISESTRAQAGERFGWRELDRVMVKGRQQAVTVFTVQSANNPGPTDIRPQGPA